MADKKRDILEFVEQSNFEQFTPTRVAHQLGIGLRFINILGFVGVSCIQDLFFSSVKYSIKS